MRDISEVLAELEPRAPRHPLDAARWPTTTPATSPTPRASARSRAQLLRAIPGLELVEPAESEICCGSAGVYNLLKPEAAEQLGRRKAENLLATGAEAVAAANPGCVLQIAASARELGHELPVVHPVEILYASMTRGGTPWPSR